MLDIGFSEIGLIFVLALVVLGPEKLPRVAAQVGRWIGRARGMARQFREQLEEEVNLEEARKAKPPAVTQTPPPAVTPPAVPMAEAAPTPAVPIAEVASTPAVPMAEVAPAPAIGDGIPLPSAPAAEATPPPLAAPQPLADPQPPAAPEQQITYPDTYSHAHPTDSLGRAIEAPNDAPAAVDSGQQDWVGVPAGDGGVTGTDKPAETPPTPAYAPSHERGT
jgi:sec-independent protein translocase protein TatB